LIISQSTRGAQAATFLREFVLGSNRTGLLLPNSKDVVGGEDPKLAGDIIPGTSVIFYGSGTTASSTIAPSASLAAWASFLATVTATPTSSAVKG
jgi:carboxypeptidase D